MIFISKLNIKFSLFKIAFIDFKTEPLLMINWRSATKKIILQNISNILFFFLFLTRNTSIKILHNIHPLVFYPYNHDLYSSVTTLTSNEPWNLIFFFFFAFSGIAAKDVCCLVDFSSSSSSIVERSFFANLNVSLGKKNSVRKQLLL